MRNMIRMAVSLVVVGLAGCETGADLVKHESDKNRATDPAQPIANAKPVAETGDADQRGVAARPAVKGSGWTAGDKIPSGKAGVPDIEVLTVHMNGSGGVCGSGKTATLAYKAMLADGTVLDPGTRPFSFKVGSGQAIAGWDIVVAKMKLGDSFTVLLPEALAYGPAKGDLKFDMELLSFK